MSREEKIAMLKRQIEVISDTIDKVIEGIHPTVSRLTYTLNRRVEELEELEAGDG